MRFFSVHNNRVRRFLSFPFYLVSAVLGLAQGLVAQDDADPGQWKAHAHTPFEAQLDALQVTDANLDEKPDLLISLREPNSFGIGLNAISAERKDLPWRFLPLTPTEEKEEERAHYGRAQALTLNPGQSPAIILPAANQGAMVYLAPSGGLSEFLSPKNWNRFQLAGGEQQQVVPLRYSVKGDFVGDDKPEVVMASDERGKSGVFLLKPGNAFWMPGYWDVRMLNGDVITRTPAAQDMDEDGDTDIVYLPQGGKPKDLAWLENPGETADPSQAWEIHTFSSPQAFITSLHAADFEHPDVPAPVRLVASDLTGNILYFYRENGEWAGKVIHTLKLVARGSRTDYMVLADMDGNGELDVLANCRTQSGDPAEGYLVWFPVSTPADTVITADNSHRVARIDHGDPAPIFDTGDFDADGDLDVIADLARRNANAQLVWFENPGS